MSPYFERSISTHQSLRPEIEGVLRGVPSHVLFHDQHDLRHPLASYTTSLHAIESTWLRVLELHERARIAVALAEPGGNLDEEAELAREYRSLLERLNEHVDTAHLILRCLRPMPPDDRSWTHESFLNGVRLPGWREFKATVHEKYRVPRLGRVVNLMKHRGAELRPTRVTSDDSVSIGFYVEGARGPGVIGPHRDVHVQWRRCETAFSYAFDMLLHFYWLYRVSEAMRHCIELTLRQDKQLALTPVYRAGAPGGPWERLCIAMSELAPDFFPDEREQRRIVVACHRDGSMLRVSAEAPGRRPRDESYQVTASIVPSEGALSVMPPYFPKQPKPRDVIANLRS